MKRPVLLSLTGITLSIPLFLSAAFASPELRDIPQEGGNFPRIPLLSARAGGGEMNVKSVLLRPKVLSIDVTYHCNLRCRMCNTWQLGNGRKPLTAEQIVDTIVAYQRRHGTSHARFLGGEPLSRKDLPEIIGAVSDKVTTEVVTNGTLMTPDLARELVRSGLHELRFSIDGPQEIHDWLRGDGAFASAEAGLDLIREAKTELGAEHPNLTVWQCVSRRSIESVGYMIDFARSKGAGFSMHFMVDGPKQCAGGALWNTTVGVQRLVDPSDICLTPSERRKVVRRYFNELATRNGSGFLAAVRTRLGGLARQWFSHVGSFLYRDCSRSMHQALIDPWGQQFTCEFLYDYEYGNCVTDGPDAWGSEKHLKLRHAVRYGQLAACRECNHFGQYRSRHDWLHAPTRLLRRSERQEAQVSREGS